ncbi:MAG: heparinase II/III domain-containing protein, partial [Chitinophagaceae bacterium]
ESTWALPAHLSLQKKYTALPNPGENIVDLGDGMTTALISWTYFLLKDQLAKVTPVLNERIRYELERRVINPYLQRNNFWWMGFHGQRVNNWNPWVNQNVLLTTLITEEDKDKLDSTVYKTMRSVDHFINQYPSDGGCDEGPAYWSHAGGELITYLELLRTSTQGKINLTDRPLICNICKYIYKMNIDKNSFVDFADAHPYLTPSIPSVFEFGEACGDDTMKQFAAYFAKQDGDAANEFLRDKNNLQSFIDYLRIYPELKNVQPQEPLMKLAWFPDLQVLTVRSKAGSAEGLFMAAKGGTNGESHNHNDVGNFIIYVNGQPEIIDIGVGTYTRETFSKDRYKIFTMQSAWHNLPTVNGIMQHEGLKYRATDVHFSESKDEARLSMNIAGTYPKEAGVKSWIRSLDFKDNEIVLHEKYDLNKYDAAFTLSLITPVQNIQVKDNNIILNDGNGNGLSIHFDPKHFDVKVGNKVLTDPALQHSWGKSLTRILLVDKLHKFHGDYTLVFREMKKEQ